MMVLRYAEVLLLYCEACLGANGGNADSEAVWAINEVRNRARGYQPNGQPLNPSTTPNFPNYTASTLNFAELLDERARELCFEFHRWFDLVRMGQLHIQFPKAWNNDKNDLTSKAEIYTLTQISDKHYLYPIPTTQLDITTNPEGFFQNPGW